MGKSDIVFIMFILTMLVTIASFVLLILGLFLGWSIERLFVIGTIGVLANLSLISFQLID